MSKMNVPRILAGGVIAGVIMNIGEAALHAGVLGDDHGVLYQTLNVPFPVPIENVPILTAVTFLMGFGAIWLYAAMRPRFGAGPKTAVYAGLAVWLFSHLWSGVYLGNGYPGIVTLKLAWVPVLWGLIEAPLATLAGAALYKEQ